MQQEIFFWAFTNVELKFKIPAGGLVWSLKPEVIAGMVSMEKHILPKFDFQMTTKCDGENPGKSNAKLLHENFVNDPFNFNDLSSR